MSKKPKYKQEVWKLQRSMMTTEAQPTVLAYNKDRSAQGEFPLTAQLRRLFGNDYKIFVKGYQNEQGQIVLVDLVMPNEEPDW